MMVNALFLKFAVTGIGALVAFISYKYYSHKNNTNNGPRDAPPKTALCSVCLKDFSNFSMRLNLPCGHPLHPECAQLIFVQRENSCPACRRQISPEFLKAHFEEM